MVPLKNTMYLKGVYLTNKTKYIELRITVKQSKSNQDPQYELAKCTTVFSKQGCGPTLLEKEHPFSQYIEGKMIL